MALCPYIARRNIIGHGFWGTFATMEPARAYALIPMPLHLPFNIQALK